MNEDDLHQPAVPTSDRPRYGGIPRWVFNGCLVALFFFENYLEESWRQIPSSQLVDLKLIALFGLPVLMALRFKNMGESFCNFLWLMVPILNIGFVIMCMVRQTGYTESHKLDRIGWILLVPVLVLVGLCALFTLAVFVDRMG